MSECNNRTTSTRMSGKLTKKQQKALQFRNKEKKPEAVEKPVDSAADSTVEEPPKKKRKTRRGRGGKGRASNIKNRFLVFVGGLPNNVTPSELQAHFKTCNPDHIRVRNDKRIAFLEFDGDKDPSGIQRRMDQALLQNGTLLRDGRKLNVELTVGGGGNSEERRQKLQRKNDKLHKETNQRISNLRGGVTNKQSSTPSNTKTHSGIHPDRLKQLQK